MDFFFFCKTYFFMTRICIFETKTQKQQFSDKTYLATNIKH